ncbi:MAG TPA: hypothetical protein VGF44_11355 [Terriglobales bacterium]|jgi:hypothetical protein
MKLLKFFPRNGFEQIRASFRKLESVPADPLVIIPFNRVVICGSCRVASNCYIGDECPACKEVGNLISLARWANSDPQLGEVSYILMPRKAEAHA